MLIFSPQTINKLTTDKLLSPNHVIWKKCFFAYQREQIHQVCRLKISLYKEHHYYCHGSPHGKKVRKCSHWLIHMESFWKLLFLNKWDSHV